ncbi:plant UBX domain-containing protein 1-like [Impatiens glandulifera]|uniref:plant UBX domain-containing protein 1-like n=1 Tax=Impatiens glandulifera TaxID=253017 RepID=UPI001FB1879B|nr:plant UBX domain-containing protein 1-like [Impatiens glandulifera]
MVLDSHPVWKKQKLSLIAPGNAETTKTLFESAKEKFGRAIRVYEISSHASAVTNDVSIADDDDADDIYDFTAEDYFRMMSSKKEDKHLKTKKIRDAEEAARRSRITKAVIRVKFPNDIILESTFHPSEPIQSLIDLMKKAIAQPNLPFYLYTTPPKKKITDMSQDFYSAGFVPGAIVYFSYDLPKGENSSVSSDPFLQEDVLSLKGLDMKSENANGAAEVAERMARVNPFSSEWKPELAAAAKKPELAAAAKKPDKPKWMKM